MAAPRSATNGFLRQVATWLLQHRPDDADLETAGATRSTNSQAITGDEVVFLLGAEGELFELGLPTAIEQVPAPGADGETMRVVFSTGEGELAVEVALDPELAAITQVADEPLA